jgi:hypothetical protein
LAFITSELNRGIRVLKIDGREKKVRIRGEGRGLLAASLILTALLAPAARAENYCSFSLKPVFSAREQHASSELFASERTYLLNSRKYWSSALGRKVSKAEAARIRLIRFLRTSILNERPAIILADVTPAANEAVSAYFLIHAKAKFIEEIRTQLIDDPANEALQKDAEKLIAEISEQSQKFARSYDYYSASYSYLAVIAAHGKGKAQASAKTILENIEPVKISEKFRSIAGIADANVPTVDALKSLMLDYPEIELDYLRRGRNQELYATLLAASPSKMALDKVKSLVLGIPGVDRKALGNFFDTVLTEEAKEIHGPNIERIGASVGTPTDKLEMLRSLNSETDDRLMVTFARMVEQRPIWASMVAAAKKTDPAFYKRMKDAMDTAEQLGDLSLDGRSAGFMIAYRAADLVFLSAIGYLGYKKVPGFFSKKADKDKADKPDAKPDPKSEPKNKCDSLADFAERLLKLQHPKTATSSAD